MDITLRRAEEALAMQREHKYALGPVMLALRALQAARLGDRAKSYAEHFAAEFGAPAKAGKTLLEVAGKAPVKHYMDGECIVIEGEESIAIHVIVSGEVRVERENVGRVATLTKGQSFGEVSMLGGTRRTASLMAVGGCSLLCLEKKFLATLRNRVPAIAKLLRNLYQRRVLSALIPSHSIFAALDADQRAALFRRFEAHSFTSGQRILREGEAGRGFYVIAAGQVKVWKKGESGVNEDLATLGPGDFFGEMSLVEDAPHSATVQSLGTCTCYKLDRASFEVVMLENPEQLRQVTAVATARKMGAPPEAVYATVTQMQALAIARMITCPRCGFDQTDTETCIKCYAHIETERALAIDDLDSTLQMNVRHLIH